MTIRYAVTPTLLWWAKDRGIGTYIGEGGDDDAILVDVEDVIHRAQDGDECVPCDTAGVHTPAAIRVLLDGDSVVEHSATGGRVPLCRECVRHGIDDEPVGLREAALAFLAA